MATRLITIVLAALLTAGCGCPITQASQCTMPEPERDIPEESEEEAEPDDFYIQVKPPNPFWRSLPSDQVPDGTDFVFLHQVTGAQVTISILPSEEGTPKEIADNMAVSLGNQDRSATVSPVLHGVSNGFAWAGFRMLVPMEADHYTAAKFYAREVSHAPDVNITALGLWDAAFERTMQTEFDAMMSSIRVVLEGEQEEPTEPEQPSEQFQEPEEPDEPFQGPPSFEI